MGAVEITLIIFIAVVAGLAAPSLAAFLRSRRRRIRQNG